MFREILRGLTEAKRLGIAKCTLGIDTWAVDYALLDSQGERIGDVFSYRDPRTNEAVDEVHRQMPFAEIYAKTGIQHLSFNTLYQLYAHDRRELALPGRSCWFRTICIICCRGGGFMKRQTLRRRLC
ncbi:hypothetical protein HMSSN036_42440 [Paenibacillus macerans]|nr:hypothetical protein HMSSN036_42440 [Paenibacillus macerans]